MRKPSMHRGKRVDGRLEGALSLVAAAVFIGVGYFEIHDLYLLKHRGEVVSGTVLEESGGRTEYITVKYRTLAGETVTEDTSNYEDADPGDTIQVVYDPKKPSRMQAADFGFDYWIPGVILGLIAAGFLAYGIIGLWR
ncbi:DUF3592 domain-containing protein [Kribbella sp. VKM Ac-2571]|uniref:DUF3592 domain-containing protein n=1 Tax=Kribbella sp. VKM Ac-2571 TaxID=2512222 RepID=UPI00106112AE|nr:DUF3592 domain-containing protein [Kribbella sp. VKM Ac-2571]